jgi:hypothetical protein
MAIIRGFPPSNSIQEGIRFPKIIETVVKISDLKLKDRYRIDECEFMFIEHKSNYVTGICYKDDQNHILGGLYSCSEDREVIWLKEVW